MNDAQGHNVALRRTFIAVHIGFNTNSEKILSDIELTMPSVKVRRVSSGNHHVTLRFIGPTPPEWIGQIQSGLSYACLKVKPFLIRVTGLGFFRNNAGQGILWAGIENSDELKDLQKEIDVSLKDIPGINLTGRFLPHVTLARCKGEFDKNALKTLLAEYRDTVFEEIHVENVIYYESFLQKSGVEYREISRHRLD